MMLQRQEILSLFNNQSVTERIEFLSQCLSQCHLYELKFVEKIVNHIFSSRLCHNQDLSLGVDAAAVISVFEQDSALSWFSHYLDDIFRVKVVHSLLFLPHSDAEKLIALLSRRLIESWPTLSSLFGHMSDIPETLLDDTILIFTVLSHHPSVSFFLQVHLFECLQQLLKTRQSTLSENQLQDYSAKTARYFESSHEIIECKVVGMLLEPNSSYRFIIASIATSGDGRLARALVERRLVDIFEFAKKLKVLFEGSVDDCQIPVLKLVYLPSQAAYSKRLVAKYLRQVINLPKHVRTSSLVLEFLSQSFISGEELERNLQSSAASLHQTNAVDQDEAVSSNDRGAVEDASVATDFAALRRRTSSVQFKPVMVSCSTQTETSTEGIPLDRDSGLKKKNSTKTHLLKSTQTQTEQQCRLRRKRISECLNGKAITTLSSSHSSYQLSGSESKALSSVSSDDQTHAARQIESAHAFEDSSEETSGFASSFVPDKIPNGKKPSDGNRVQDETKLMDENATITKNSASFMSVVGRYSNGSSPAQTPSSDSPREGRNGEDFTMSAYNKEWPCLQDISFKTQKTSSSKGNATGLVGDSKLATKTKTDLAEAKSEMCEKPESNSSSASTLTPSSKSVSNDAASSVDANICNLSDWLSKYSLQAYGNVLCKYTIREFLALKSSTLTSLEMPSSVAEHLCGLLRKLENMRQYLARQQGVDSNDFWFDTTRKVILPIVQDDEAICICTVAQNAVPGATAIQSNYASAPVITVCQQPLVVYNPQLAQSLCQPILLPLTTAIPRMSAHAEGQQSLFQPQNEYLPYQAFEVTAAEASMAALASSVTNCVRPLGPPVRNISYPALPSQASVDDSYAASAPLSSSISKVSSSEDPSSYNNLISQRSSSVASTTSESVSALVTTKEDADTTIVAAQALDESGAKIKSNKEAKPLLTQKKVAEFEQQILQNFSFGSADSFSAKSFYQNTTLGVHSAGIGSGLTNNVSLLSLHHSNTFPQAISTSTASAFNMRSNHSASSSGLVARDDLRYRTATPPVRLSIPPTSAYDQETVHSAVQSITGGSTGSSSRPPSGLSLHENYQRYYLPQSYVAPNYTYRLGRSRKRECYWCGSSEHLIAKCPYNRPRCVYHI